MIELRWLDYTKNKGQCRTLQYRVAVAFIVSQEVIDIDRRELIDANERVMRWSEWITVPVVRGVEP